VVTIFLAFSPHVLYGFVHQPKGLNTGVQIQNMPLPDGALLKVTQQMGKMYSNTVAPMKHHVEADKLHMEALFLEIDQYMHEKKPFLRQNLSIHELAAEIGIPVYALSKAINSVKGINYNKWLNQYRIPSTNDH
jgi:YesN/AraC family two-component response regulator